MPRILFEKVGDAVYISHLDLMRVFQRAFRRAGILIRHSQGYNPRAYVSIALPLSVGTESVCELLDFELAEGVDVSLKEIPSLLNRSMPAGVRALEIWETGRKLRELTHLDAELLLEDDAGVPENAVAELEDFFCGDSPITVSKKTKSGPAEIDIRPMIMKLQLEPKSSRELRILCRVCAQNPSLNPALLGDAIALHLPGLKPDFVRVKRLEIFDAGGTPFR